MPDHPNQSASNEAAPMNTVLDLEAARCAFAAARVRALAALELRLLELAVEAPDDERARRLELQADTVWRDAQALSAEHDPDQPSSLREHAV